MKQLFIVSNKCNSYTSGFCSVKLFFACVSGEIWGVNSLMLNENKMKGNQCNMYFDVQMK